MSRPVKRTAWSEMENRRQSPSSAQMIAATDGPIPYWACSARGPGCRQPTRDELPAQRQLICAVSESIATKAVSTQLPARPATARRRAARPDRCR